MQEFSLLARNVPFRFYGHLMLPAIPDNASLHPVIFSQSSFSSNGLFSTTSRNFDYATDNLPNFILLTLSFVCATVTVAYFWGFMYNSSIEATSTYPVIALLCNFNLLAHHNLISSQLKSFIFFLSSSKPRLPTMSIQRLLQQSRSSVSSLDLVSRISKDSSH